VVVTWRSGVVSSALTTASFGGVAPRGLHGGRVLFDTSREEAPSGAMVASSAGSAKFMRILTMKIARWFNGCDDFYGVYTRCSLRVC
jgi:hypothetical protein